MSDRMSKGTAGQSGANASGWAKSKDRYGVVSREQRDRHWWLQA